MPVKLIVKSLAQSIQGTDKILLRMLATEKPRILETSNVLLLDAIGAQ